MSFHTKTNTNVRQKTKEKLRNDEERLLNSKNIQIAEGVKFTRYDEYGLPIDDGNDYQQFICKDHTVDPNDIMIDAPKEMMNKMLFPTGIRKDYEKKYEEMNEEGKFSFQPDLIE